MVGHVRMYREKNKEYWKKEEKKIKKKTCMLFGKERIFIS